MKHSHFPRALLLLTLLASPLPAAEVTLTADILDRIDQLVAPGVTINPDDNSYGEAELTPEALRRTM